MWRARYLGQHCRDSSKLLNLLKLQEGELPQALTRRARAKLEAPPNPSADPPLMKATTSTAPEILHTPCCGGLGKSALAHHPASVVPPRHLVSSRHIFSSSKSTFLRPHFGLFTRNASHLVPLRIPEIEKREAEGSPRVALHGVRRPVRKESSDDTAAEQQVRHRSNQAVRRQVTVPVYHDYARLWRQGSNAERNWREVLQGGDADWTQYWQKKEGDWGRFEAKWGSAREGVRGALGKVFDERGLDAEQLAEEEGAAEPFSPVNWQAEDLEGESAAIAADMIGDRSLVGETDSEEAASPLDLGQAGTMESAAADLGREFSEDEGVELSVAEAPQEQLREGQELRGNGGLELRATEPPVERRRGPKPKPAEERQRYRMLRQRQHKMEAKSLDTAVKKFQEELKERRKRGVTLGSETSLMTELFDPLERAIDRERNAILNGERGMDRKNYGPYFLLLESDKLAALTLQCVLNAFLMPDGRGGSSHDGHSARDQRHRLAEKGWVKVVTVVMDLGQAVETESNLARMVHLYQLRQRQTKKKKKELEQKLKLAAVELTAEEGSEASTEVEATGTAEGGEESSREASPLEEEILMQLEELAAEGTSKDKQRRREARAGVEAVMRVYFPDQFGLEATKQGYRMMPLKELMQPGSRHRINYHAKQAIESNTDWGADVHAKVGAALLQIFLQATEVAPSVFEPRGPPNAKLLNAIEKGEVDGVSPKDTPLLYENARTFDQDFQWNEAIDKSSLLPETAPRLDDTASTLPDPAHTIAAAPSEDIGEKATVLDSTETAIQQTMREMEERSEQYKERRRLSAEAETSQGGATKAKKKRRGRSGQRAAELAAGADAASEVSGTEKAREKAKPGTSLASLVRMSASNAIGDAVLAPIVAAVNSNLIQTLDAHVRSAPAGADPVPIDAESPELPVEEETRAAMLEAAIRKFGPEWGHLSVPKKGKQQFRIPAFRHTLRMLKGSRGGPVHKCGVLEVHPAILEKLSQETAALADRFPRHMPMLVPPKPWTSHNRGGQLLLRNLVMRTRGSRMQLEALRKAQKLAPGGIPRMQPVFDALNALGIVPWKINAPVSRVVEQVWELCEHEGATAGLPRRVLDPLPKKPEGEDATDRTIWREYKRALAKVKQANSETVSQRGDMILKLSTMQQLRDEERFFFPHTLDFRGRAYPIHPYLNHLGADVCRGMLMFADGRPLGERGLRWLKIHLANLVGNSVDKLSFDEREKYCNEHMAEIMDSADRPMAGNRWWMKAEDPFQALATCMEITKAVRSGDPQSYVCALAVHQDGSCNGLQHYAALGKDIRGAEHVNMLAMDKPADVYTGIADTVREKVEADAAKGRHVALALRDHVDRKLVKQTVMTSVYGVTFIGARQQIRNRLKEKGVTEDDQLLFQLTMYATKVTLASLGEIFNSARAIMSWLGHCAVIISGKRPEGCDDAVMWTTPLGLPVVQPYKKRSKKIVQTVLQSVFLEDEQEADKVHPLKQRTAFAPNYVHSLDATHMMMTAIACRKAGLCFAGVHDSYWTHAGDVERMNEILREKFIELHSQPLLENLLAEFREMYPETEFPPVPIRGEFDVRSVRDAPYFFD